MIDLEAIFGECAATIQRTDAGSAAGDASAVNEPAALADLVGKPTAASVPEANPTAFVGWVLRPDSRGVMGWQAPEAPDPWLAWEDLSAFPHPCPTCGSLELWEDALGGWHCQRCERATFERGLRLAERAARLRGGSQQENGKGAIDKTSRHR